MSAFISGFPPSVHCILYPTYKPSVVFVLKPGAASGLVVAEVGERRRSGIEAGTQVVESLDCSAQKVTGTIKLVTS